MVGLRPHTTARVMTSIAFMAWHKYGAKDVDPKTAAEDWSKSMDSPA